MRDYITYVRAAMGKAAEDWVDFDIAYGRTDWSKYKNIPAFEGRQEIAPRPANQKWRSRLCRFRRQLPMHGEGQGKAHRHSRGLRKIVADRPGTVSRHLRSRRDVR
jgi:hypothetical protein